MTFTALDPSALPTARVHLAPLGSRPYAVFREPQNFSLSEIAETAITCMVCPPIRNPSRNQKGFINREGYIAFLILSTGLGLSNRAIATMQRANAMGLCCIVAMC